MGKTQRTIQIRKVLGNSMIQKLTSFLNYGTFAEIALLIFALVFVAVVIRTLMTTKDISRRNAQIVLDEAEEKSA